MSDADLNHKIRPTSYVNDDLAPVTERQRTWGTWNFAALWISMSLCIPTYMLASSLIDGGMNWWEAILTILIGNTVVLIPMILNGHAGARYGIPFPVFARASFGVRGANIPAMLRAIVACGWFGIQTWIGGYAIFQLLKVWAPSIAGLPKIFPDSWGLETGPAITFLAFWLVNMAVVYLGVESIRKLLVFKAFFLPIAAAALLFWAISASHGLGPILAQPSKFKSSDEFWAYFFPALTGMVGFWATLSLNIPDFTRYAKSQRAQILGQAIGLPPAMTLFAFVGVAVTSATTIIFGQTIWDPVVLAGKFESRIFVTFAMGAVALSTLATNIAANIVSPANDFSNLAPAKIDFRMGGYITGVIGILIFPWKLIADPQGYIFKWLIAYSSLLGPVGGIMITDYFFVRRQRLKVDDLYRAGGLYWFSSGVNWAAVAALLLGILPNVPGFLMEIGVISGDSAWAFAGGLYHYAWFIGFGVSAVAYGVFMRAFAKTELAAVTALLALLILPAGGCGFPTATPVTGTAPSGATIITIPPSAAGLGAAAYGANPVHIAAGTTVAWHNTDTMAHTATSSGNFDTGSIPAGGYSSAVTIANVGTYNYYCTIHGQTSMNGQIVSP